MSIRFPSGLSAPACVLLAGLAGAQVPLDVVGSVVINGESTLVHCPVGVERAFLGSGLASAGDFDGDGVLDLFVTAAGSPGALTQARAHLLLMTRLGRPWASFPLYVGFYGQSIASLGDLDGNGVVDAVVGAVAPTGGSAEILLLDAAAQVTRRTIVAPEPSSHFATAVAGLGDLDGDGVGELAVGAPGLPASSGLPSSPGKVWIFFLDAAGNVKRQMAIEQGAAGFTGTLDVGDRFGGGLAALGDLDGNGTPDLAVCAPGDDDGGPDRGAIWILFLEPGGTVGSHRKITSLCPELAGLVGDGANMGSYPDLFPVLFANTGTDGIEALSDFDGDGTVDLGVVLYELGDARVLVLLLRRDGSLKGVRTIHQSQTTFDRPASLATLGDLDWNGTPEVAVGNPFWFGVSCFLSGSLHTLYLAPAPLAAVATRNGGTNPSSYRASAPILGGTATLTVDLTTTGHAQALVLGFDGPAAIALGGGQTLLCMDTLGAGELVHTGFWPGPLASIPLSVPSLSVLLGLRVYTQALHAGDVLPFALSNAQDLTIGVVR